MAPPELSEEQRRAALAKAAEARRVRAEIREQLKSGRLGLAELLQRADRDPLVAGMKVSTVLSSLPGTGKVKANRLMEAHGIADNRRLRGLGERQRSSLVTELG